MKIKNRFLHILFIILIVSSFTVYSSGLDGWFPLGNNIFADNLQTKTITADWGNSTSVEITSNTAIQHDSLSPPNYLMTSEIEGLEGKYFVVRDNSGIKIVKQNNMIMYHFEPNSGTVTGEFYLGDIDEDDITELIYLNNISGTNYLIEVELNHPLTPTNLTELPSKWNIGESTPSCFKEIGENPNCYFRTPDNRYVKVAMNNKSIYQYNDSLTTSTYSIPIIPLIGNIDQDIFDILEGFFIKRLTSNGAIFSGIETFMLNLETMTPSTTYSDDGYLNLSASAGTTTTNFEILQPLLYQGDDSYSGSSPFEIGITLNYLRSNDDVRAFTNYFLNSDGTTIFSESFEDGTIHGLFGSNIIPNYDFEGLSPHIALCQIYKNASPNNASGYLNCYSGDMSSQIINKISGNTFEIGATGSKSTGDQIATYIYSADVNNDQINDIITSFGIVDLLTADTFFNFNEKNYFPKTNYTPIPIVDDNDKLAFLFIDNNQSILIKSISAETTNFLPTITSNFKTSFLNPICTGTELIIFGNEHNESEAPEGNENYYNDKNDDLERLRTDCGGESGLKFSEFSNNEPNLICNFTNSGTFFVEIFLQDNFNPSDLSVSVIQEINVIDFSEEGELCNDELGFDIDDITNPQNVTGTPCEINDDCLSGLCEYKYCALKEGNMDCSTNTECLSGQCKNNKCTAPSLNTRIDNFKDQTVGDDDITNNGLSLVLMYFWLIPLSGFGVAGIVGGLILAIPLGIIFVAKGWLSTFIFVMIIMTKVILFVLAVMLFGKSE